MDKTEIALRQYENLRKAQQMYLERKRQAKKDAGTYRPRGRPRKNADADKLFTRTSEESAEVEVASEGV